MVTGKTGNKKKHNTVKLLKLEYDFIQAVDIDTLRKCC